MPKGEEAGSLQPFKIFETRRFLTDLAGLGSVAQKRLEAKLRDYVYPILRQTPHCGPNIKRLKNWDPPTWRYRVGNWRFFYEIDERQRIAFMTAADPAMTLIAKHTPFHSAQPRKRGKRYFGALSCSGAGRPRARRPGKGRASQPTSEIDEDRKPPVARRAIP